MIFIESEKDIPSNAIQVIILDKGFNVVLDNEDDGKIELLNQKKSIKHLEIEKEYRSALITGFQSGNNFYSSDKEDMQDLVNAVTTNSPQQFKSMDGVMRSFSPQEIKKVLIDVTKSKLDLVKQRDSKHKKIQEAKTIDELNLL